MADDKLSDRARDLLATLEYMHNRASHRKVWCTPLDLGGTNGSHHSNTLATLAKRGLVQFKQRGHPNPPDGENGVKCWRGRGSKCYRITPAGMKAIGRG